MLVKVAAESEWALHLHFRISPNRRLPRRRSPARGSRRRTALSCVRNGNPKGGDVCGSVDDSPARRGRRQTPDDTRSSGPLAGLAYRGLPEHQGLQLFHTWNILPLMAWSAEHTDEFADWYAGLSEAQQDDITAVGLLLME